VASILEDFEAPPVANSVMTGDRNCVKVFWSFVSDACLQLNADIREQWQELLNLYVFVSLFGFFILRSFSTLNRSWYGSQSIKTVILDSSVLIF